MRQATIVTYANGFQSVRIADATADRFYARSKYNDIASHKHRADKRGLFYAKASKGIEKQPSSKAMTHSKWNWYHNQRYSALLKGKDLVPKYIYREKSKSEINALIDNK